MENLKSFLFSVLLLALLGAIGYWAFNTLESGGEYRVTEEVKQLKKENQELKKEIEDIKNTLAKTQSQAQVKEPEPVAKPITPIEQKPAEKPIATPVVKYKNQILIDEIQKLINLKITLKLKSIGPRVGTVQKFFNVFNNTTNKIDNDYGTTTAKQVSAFQQLNGLKVTGEVDSNTFSKMIEWLKKQG